MPAVKGVVVVLEVSIVPPPEIEDKVPLRLYVPMSVVPPVVVVSAPLTTRLAVEELVPLVLLSVRLL